MDQPAKDGVHVSTTQLEAGLAAIRDAPATRGRIEIIVRRPAVDEREILDRGELDLAVGLVGDTWPERPSSKTADKRANPECQVTLMNAAAARLIAGSEARMILAGDQFYVDFDISVANLPAGTRLQLGSAVLEVTANPHTGCAKFGQRFGPEAWRFVNSPEGSALRLRGVNTKVVIAGTVNRGDAILKAPTPEVP